MKDTILYIASRTGLISYNKDVPAVPETVVSPPTSPTSPTSPAPPPAPSKSTKAAKNAKEPKIPKKKTPKPNSSEYPMHLAHNIKDLITGEDHSSHVEMVEKKKLMKALQKEQTARAVVDALKQLPPPTIMPIQDDVIGHAIPGKIMTIKKTNKTTLRENKINIRSKNPFDPNAAEQINPQHIVVPAIAGVAAIEAIAITQHAAHKTLAPPHNVKPPTNSVSAYTYWWGYEIYVPHTCMNRLNEAQDITNAFLGFFTIIIAGVPMLRPYIPYISAWVGLQFSLIKSQDIGKGVVLAATWILPIAVVPRSWDVVDNTVAHIN